MAENNDDKPAKPSDTVAFLAEARKRFDRCVEATSENRAYQLDDIRFAAGSPDNGWQWPTDILNARLKDPNGPRPALTINKLPQHIKLVTNEQRKNKPMGKILPVGDGDEEVAEVLTGVTRHIEVASHAEVAYDTACENQVTIGEGYWRILTDYMDEKSFDQDIRIAMIKNSFSVYMDPDGLRKDSTGRYCDYAFITDRMPTATYKREFPNAKSKTDWDLITTGDDTFEWFDDDGVMIAEYFYVTYEKGTIWLMSDGSVVPAMTDEEMAANPPPLGLTVTGKRETQYRRVKWCKINGVEILEEQDWVGKYIPVVRVVGNEWEVQGRMVCSGIVRNAKDPQRMFNYWSSTEAEVLALAPKAPFVGAVGQFENQEDRWRTANTVNYAYLEYNPIEVNGLALPPPQRQAPPLPPAGIISAKMGSADDLQSTVGQYNPSVGATSKETSGRAIQARQQQADVGTFHYVDNLSRSIQYSTEIMLDLIPKIYDQRRVVRIIGVDGEVDQCEMCVGQGQSVAQETDEMGAVKKIYDPSVGNYDVTVTVGPGFETRRLEMSEFLTNATQSAKDPVTIQILTYLALKASDWSGAEEATKMLKKLLPPQVLETDKLDPNDVEAQMQKVQQAAQQIGQKEAELNDAHQQVAQLAEQATQQEAKAKEATAKAQAKVDEINTQQEALIAHKQTLDLSRRLAESELRNKALENDAKIKEAVFTVERLLAKHELAVRGEIDSSSGPAEEKSAVTPETVDAILQSTAATADAVRNMLSTLSAERETELINDDMGNPIGSRSRIVQQPAEPGEFVQ